VSEDGYVRRCIFASSLFLRIWPSAERHAAIGTAMSDVPTSDRVCGRCRASFAGDPELFFQTDWALCPDCSAVLMPKSGRKSGH